MKPSPKQQLNCIRNRIEDCQNYFLEHGDYQYPQSFCSFTIKELYDMREKAVFEIIMKEEEQDER